MAVKKGEELITIMSPTFEPFPDHISKPTKVLSTIDKTAPNRLDPVSLLCKNEMKNFNSKIGNPIIFTKDLNLTMERAKFNNTPESLLKRVIQKGMPDS